MGWKARFVPQAWINNHAVDVDAQGATEWQLSDEDAEIAIPEACHVCSDLDYLQDHENAPAWVRNWHGPFYIELIDANGLAVSWMRN